MSFKYLTAVSNIHINVGTFAIWKEFYDERTLTASCVTYSCDVKYVLVKTKAIPYLMRLYMPSYA